MPSDYDLVIRNAYTMEQADVVDLAVQAGRIVDISSTFDGTGTVEIDAESDLVSPGLFDCHLHMDKALTARGGRVPGYNESQPTLDEIVSRNWEYFANATPTEIERHARNVVKQSLVNGTMYFRSQTYTGGSGDLRSIEGLLAAKQALADVVEVQIVAFPQDGIGVGENKHWIHEAVAAGADFVGGIDPATRNNDVERTIESWFDIATTFDVGIDAHVHEPGALGMYTLNRIAEHAIERGYRNRVTASHGFALADANEHDQDVLRYPDAAIENALPRFVEAGMSFVTCYPSTRPEMPIRRFAEAGVPIGIGSDNVQDYTNPRQRGNMLEGGLIAANKLEYATYGYMSNPGLRTIWGLLTTESAKVFGTGETYGVAEGNPADLVVFDAPSPEWAIVDQASARFVIKGGNVVVEEGSIAPEYQPLFPDVPS